MLGLALSVGASGVLFADSEATAAVGSFITKSAASNESPQLPSVLGNQFEQHSVGGQGLAVYHTVEQGDSLWQIAKEHQVEIQDIKVANRISPDAPLQVGQVIKVPNEESNQPTLVSLLPGVQRGLNDNGQKPSLDTLMASIADTDAAVSVQEVEEFNTASEPAIVATEELTGDVSLRSAGLVSQSDGFQSDLAQLNDSSVEEIQVDETEGIQADLNAPIIDELVSEPTTALSEDDINAASEGYQVEVRPGDTVENIAIALGTTSEELAEANDLEDPDFIVAGEALAIPEEVTKELVISEAVTSLAQATPDVTVSSSGIGGFDGTRLSRLQSTVENRIDASSMLDKLQGAQLVEIDQSVSNEIAEGDVVAVEDPYTADLLADIDSAQEVGDSLTPDSEVALLQSASSTDSLVVNPEFQASQLEARAVSDEGSQSSELLAAAPLDPSIYVSSPSPATGQVVSPEMPILPSADEYLPEAPDYFNGYIWPTRGTLTSGYGWRWGRMHRGIDVAGPVGTPIVSAAPGVVERAGWNSGGYGNLVEVRHADGSMTRYAHNSRIVVRSGQRVSQGQHIADMGSTGYSTGPHLHFEVHLPNRGTVNPMAMLPGQ